MTATPAPAGLDAFIAGLPKAELHVHHVGSASPAHRGRTGRPPPGLGRCRPTRPRSPTTSPSATSRTSSRSTSSVVDLIRDAEDVRLLTYEVARDMARQNIRYAELTVTPYQLGPARHPGAGVHARRSRTPARRRRRSSASCCAGASTSPARRAWRRRRRPRGIALDLRARRAGLASASAARRSACRVRSSSRTSTGPAPPGCTASRTPARPPGRRPIWDALNDLGAERIGHGTSAAQDPALLAHLAEHRIPLEVCPTSNIATRAVATLEEHPIREMVDGRASWSPSTATTRRCSAPTSTPSTRVAARLLDLDDAGVAALARNAVEASFLDAPAKAKLAAEIDAYTAVHRTAVR